MSRDVIRKAEEAAESRGPCSCERCAGACQVHPGLFAPGEVARASAVLSMRPEHFVERFCHVLAERVGGPRMPVFALAPRQQYERFGVRNPDNWRPYGRCALLGASGCRLPMDARPAACRTYYGCDFESHASVGEIYDAIVAEWDTEDGQQEARAWLPLQRAAMLAARAAAVELGAEQGSLL